MGKTRIICADVLKRPQELLDFSKIKGRFMNCRAAHLEGFSLKYLFQIIKEISQSVIVADGDVKLANLVKETDWLKPVTLAMDLAHLLKNLKSKIQNLMKASNLGVAVKGIANKNKMMFVEHIQKNLLYFARKIPKKDRNLNTWSKMVEKMFLHLEGNKIDNYECSVPECKMRNFCVNKFDKKNV